jgi:hypothetical protein
VKLLDIQSSPRGKCRILSDMADVEDFKGLRARPRIVEIDGQALTSFIPRTKTWRSLYYLLWVTRVSWLG